MADGTLLVTGLGTPTRSALEPPCDGMDGPVVISGSARIGDVVHEIGEGAITTCR